MYPGHLEATPATLTYSEFKIYQFSFNQGKWTLAGNPGTFYSPIIFEICDEFMYEVHTNMGLIDR
mgnify:CR=1 FL=1